MGVLKYRDPDTGEWVAVGSPIVIPSGCSTVTYLATVTATWSTSGDYFYQDISVPGILETDNPIVDIVPGEDNAANVVYSENMCKVFRITTFADSIRVWATEAIASAFPIQLKVVR